MEVPRRPGLWPCCRGLRRYQEYRSTSATVCRRGGCTMRKHGWSAHLLVISSTYLGKQLCLGEPQSWELRPVDIPWRLPGWELDPAAGLRLRGQGR